MAMKGLRLLPAGYDYYDGNMDGVYQPQQAQMIGTVGDIGRIELTLLLTVFGILFGIMCCGIFALYCLIATYCIGFCKACDKKQGDDADEDIVYVSDQANEHHHL